MASLEEIRNERIKKLNSLKEGGFEVYPIYADHDVAIEDVLSNFSKLSKRKKPLTLVGRVLSKRGQGGIVFLSFSDGTQTMQGMLKKGETNDTAFSLFDEVVDVGDFLQFSGILFTTKRGEKTLLIKEWKMLAKSLRSLPDKWHGLQDVEERFRKRYLDILMSAEVKKRFIIRTQLIREIRSFLDGLGYIEVETPVLQPLYGGASAKPFKTHHNALDVDLFLRISDELYLKRLLIAGFPKVYEISKDFRNEGIDATHYPEFTQLEFYEAYSDAGKQMVLVEKLFKIIVKKLTGKSSLEYNEVKINFSPKFKVISYFDVIERYALITDPKKKSREELVLKAQQLAVLVEKGDSEVKILDNIYKKVCRPKLIQPTFITNYPVNYFPLAKKQKGSDALVDAFQLVIGGIELVKAFSELNDPIEQRARFEKQEEFGKAGDDEAQTLDEEYLEALEYGMPPAGGVGIGIDRLMMILTDTKNIKETILFPTMRPKE